MKKNREWAGFALFVLAAAVGISGFVWWTSRPVELAAEDLIPTETCESYPETELSLELTKYKIAVTFHNNSDTTFYHGDPPDYSSLDVRLDGKWYYVPHEDYSTAGVGMETGPEQSFTFEPILAPYGKLPDGEYRISFGFWNAEVMPIDRLPEGVLYARFDVSDGYYIQPQTP